MKSKLLTTLRLAGALALTGCNSQEKTDSTNIRHYFGESNGHKVEIFEKVDYKHRGNTRGNYSYHTDASVTCYMVPTNSTDVLKEMIVGYSDKWNGGFEIVVAGTLDDHPSRKFLAKKLLEQAVIDVANEEHLSPSP